MARELVNFAGGGAVVADNRFDPELSKEITQYIEKESDFRQFIKVVKVNTYYVTLPRKWAAGIAVEIVEGSEIPKARDVYDQLSFNLRQIGTGIKMTDEEQQMMGFDPNYFQTEARRANERLLKKENNDIRLCLMSGAGYNIVTPSGNGDKLKFDDIVDVKTLMSENPYGVNPDMILMSERTYADLLKDDDFKTYSNSGIAGVKQNGEFGERVAGLAIKIIPELLDTVFIIDSSLDPIILVTMNGVHTEKYRLPETREDVLDLTYWEKPAVVRPDAIARIDIVRPANEAHPRKDYGKYVSSNPVDNDAIMQQTIVSKGWDPVDGYADPDNGYPTDDYEEGKPIAPEDSPRYGGDEEDSPSSGG
ncbi:MAG: phage major capsid protein [Bacilli bacterium]|nr:phage major capsid protein [Bacilli bacterium]